MSVRIRIATRRSPLALWQAEHVASRLREAHPSLQVSLLPMTTTGDIKLQGPLSQVGGKGLFVKELEQALLDGEADIAVHSMKDVPATFPQGLGLAVVLAGENPHDAFVSNEFDDLDALPKAARLGTASLRRACQIRAHRPDLDIRSLRGNVNTRLRKLDEGEYDAIVLACAGLQRLGMDERIRQAISADICLPAVGQGVVGIEQRLDDAVTADYLACLEDRDSTVRIACERAMNKALGGSCQAPVAGHAVIRGDQLEVTGLVGSPDGKILIRLSEIGTVNDAVTLGERLAQRLLDAGGRDILAALETQSPAGPGAHA